MTHDRRLLLTSTRDRVNLAFALYLLEQFHAAGGRGADPDPAGLSRGLAEQLGVADELDVVSGRLPKGKKVRVK